MKRDETLSAALKAIMGERNQSYGTPEDNFTSIALLWSAHLGKRLNGRLYPHDIAALMALMKIARLATSPTKADSWIDLAGYAACGAEVANAE